MPTAYVKKLAKKHNMSVSKAENKWEEAKEKAEEQGHKEDYGYITSIFKSMMGESLEENTDPYPQRYYVKFQSLDAAREAHNSMSSKHAKGLEPSAFKTLDRDNGLTLTVKNQEGYQNMKQIIDNYRGKIEQINEKTNPTFKQFLLNEFIENGDSLDELKNVAGKYDGNVVRYPKDWAGMSGELYAIELETQVSHFKDDISEDEQALERKAQQAMRDLKKMGLSPRVMDRYTTGGRDVAYLRIIVTAEEQ